MNKTFFETRGAASDARDENVSRTSFIANEIEPQQVAPGVFTGISTATSGETVYLKMELITEENQKYWGNYLLNVRKMIYNRCRGQLTYLVNFIEPHTDTDGSTHYHFQDGDKTYELGFGFNEYEFNRFVDFLGQQGFIKGSKKTEALLKNDIGNTCRVRCRQG